MNKPERLPHPDFAHWLPTSLREVADDQKAIPRIAKDAALMRAIEAALPAIPTTHDLWRGDARARFHPRQQRASGADFAALLDTEAVQRLRRADRRH